MYICVNIPVRVYTYIFLNIRVYIYNIYICVCGVCVCVCVCVCLVTKHSTIVRWDTVKRFRWEVFLHLHGFLIKVKNYAALLFIYSYQGNNLIHTFPRVLMLFDLHTGLFKICACAVDSVRQILKMVLDASLFKTQHYKVRIKGRAIQRKELCLPLHFSVVAIKGSIYLSIYIYIYIS